MQTIPVTWPYVLRRGHVDDPAEGACAMDAVNWLAHGKHGDAPACACPVIGAYVISGNDVMPDDIRQGLLPYLHRIAGSRSRDHRVAWMRIMVRAALRTFAPRALDAAGLDNASARLRALSDDVKGLTAAEAEVLAHDVAGRVGRGAASAATMMAARAMQAEVLAMQRAAATTSALRAAAEWAVRAAAHAAAWEDYFAVLDAALSAGPQGDPWSADAVDLGAARYAAAGGKQLQTA